MYISDHIITAKHYLVHFVCAYAAGIYLAAGFGIIFTAQLSLVAFILTLMICCILKARNSFKAKYIILSVVLIVASSLGTFRIYIAEYIHSSYLRQYQNQEVWLCGTITSDPDITSTGYYYSFELDVFGVADKTGRFGSIIMYTPISTDFNFNSGDSIYAWTSLKSPQRNEDLSHFDYYTHLRGKNIYLVGTAKNINFLPENSIHTPTDFIKVAGMWVRNKIGYSVDMIFAGNSLFTSILKGILIGDKTGFNDELYQKFSYSGISHIVAVSGLHISILFSFLMTASKHFRLNKRLNLIITIPVIILFMSSSAFTPSVCRAGIMILIMVFSALFREEYNPVTSLFLALGLILTAMPYSLFSKSLILSFAATLGIFVYFPYINGLLVQLINLPKLRLERHPVIKKSLFFFSSSVSLSLSTFWSTAYFLVLFFDGVSMVQFLTNLWIIPLVSVIFCLGYVCCILYYACPILVTAVLKYPLGWCLCIIKFTIDKFGTPQNVLNISGGSLNGISVIIYSGIALMIYMLLKTVQDIIVEHSSLRRLRKEH